MVASSASMASLERFHPYRRAGPSTWCGAADSSAFEPLERGRNCYVITSYCPYSPKCVELEFSEVHIQHFAYPWPHGTQGWTRGAYLLHTRHAASCCVHDLAQRRMGHGSPQGAQVYRQCS